MQGVHFLIRVLLLVFLIWTTAGNICFGQIAEKKQVKAHRIVRAPNIDANLNDTAWYLAEPASDFIKLQPYNGDPSNFNTEVRFVYDDQALYIGARLYDPFPDSIFTELSERDNRGMADYFGVSIDCFNDYLTAFGFQVTASGVQIDYKSTSEDEDRSWDAVWESKVRLVDDGWIVEMMIPYSALRFPKKNKQEWGLQIYRNVTRYRQRSTWNFINLEEDGVNNQSGILNGIENINPPLRLSLVPYLSGYLEKGPNTNLWGYSYNYGLDLKYGINESYTLDMTLVPDFGQVVSDDEIYNLSPFEVYFNERRPFFTEGTELFNKGNVFYSRRVGKTPSGYYGVSDSLEEFEEITDNPQHAQLVNATKISGKNARKLAVGFFNAMTANTWAEVQDTINGSQRRIKTEPFTNYNMLVLDQALKNNSYFSLYNTNVYQPESKFSANVTGSELKLTTKNNLLAIWLNGIVSQKFIQGINPEFGYRYTITAGKISGNLTYEFTHNVIDDKYDPNDMGFLRHNNVFAQSLSFSYNIYKPVWHLLSMRNSLWFSYAQLYEPRVFTEFSIGFRSRMTFKNFLSAWLNLNLTPTDKYDYWEPRVENRYFIRPSNYKVMVGISPDYRKRFLVDLRGTYSWTSLPTQYLYSLNVSPRFRINNRWMLVLKSEYIYDNNNIGYVTDSLNPENKEEVIFGIRNIDTWENTLEVNYRFSNKSSLALRCRHYWITLKYNEFLYLNQDGTLSDTDYEDLHDFSYNIFNVDMQYIWNFAPGSEMRVVWKNAINTYEQQEMVNSVVQPIEDNFGGNLGNVLSSPATNSFSIKLLYYIDYQQIKKAFTK